MSNEHNNAAPVSKFIEQANALLRLDDANALVPHGIGGFARELLTEAIRLLSESTAPTVPQDEPFGYFRVDALGWSDCAATDEGAIALYERPAAPAVPQGEPCGREVLAQVFSLCEDTENMVIHYSGSSASEGFVRGRKFEAKGIRKAIGTWFQDQSKSTSPAQEPVVWLATRLWNARDLWTCPADIERMLAATPAPAPAVPSVLKRGYGRLIQAAADLALQQFMPSDIVDDYPSKTISAAKVAKMMTQPRDRLRLLSIEVSEGAKQMLAATPATPSQEHAVNLSCRSTQARLAAQWGYVPAPSQEPAVPQGWTDADSDAARLALELECLLLDTENLSVVSKWWASANEALELHRRRLATPAAPSQDPYKDSTPHLSEKEALR